MRATLGQYIPRNSAVHALDARTKLFIMAMGIAAAFKMDGAYPLAGFLAGLVVVTRMAKIKIREVERGLVPFAWLFLVTGALHALMTPGDPISSFLPRVTRQGLQNGALVATQLVGAIWISTLATLTTSPLDMVRALEWYMKPLKHLRVPVDEIALAVMLAIRFIPVLFEEAERITKAQKARGVDVESGNLLKKTRSMVSIVIPLMHGVFRKADDLSVALMLRGYRPGIIRSSRKIERFGAKDLFAVLCAGAWLFLLANM